jgi:hypothetical protein
VFLVVSWIDVYAEIDLLGDFERWEIVREDRGS